MFDNEATYLVEPFPPPHPPELCWGSRFLLALPLTGARGFKERESKNKAFVCNGIGHERPDPPTNPSARQQLLLPWQFLPEKGVGLAARTVLFPSGDGARAAARAGLEAANIPEPAPCAKCEPRAALQACIQGLGWSSTHLPLCRNAVPSSAGLKLHQSSEDRNAPGGRGQAGASGNYAKMSRIPQGCEHSTASHV